jgi:hypothetical protein
MLVSTPANSLWAASLDPTLNCLDVLFGNEGTSYRHARKTGQALLQRSNDICVSRHVRSNHVRLDQRIAESLAAQKFVKRVPSEFRTMRRKQWRSTGAFTPRINGSVENYFHICE